MPKIERSAFLYLEGANRDFAQCGTCYAYAPDDKRCALFGPKVSVAPTDSCGFYLKAYGSEAPALTTKNRVSPKDAGFYKGSVRCENCYYGGGGKCGLYQELNKKLPDYFDLDINIEPRACCNAFTPK
jgi:hypothetical protein